MAEENENQVVGLVKASSNVLCQFYQDLAQPSVKAMGQALATVFELCPNSLLSLKLWTEKRKLNFAKRLNEYKEKLEQIPKEKRCEVDPQIGTPIVEKLTYTTNDEIANLFTTLLANASNIDTVNRAHPAFIDIIARLSEDEARIITYLQQKPYIPFYHIKDYSLCFFKLITPHLNPLTLLEKDENLRFPKNINAYFDNLLSLGILKRVISNSKSKDDDYAKIIKYFSKPVEDATPKPIHDLDYTNPLHLCLLEKYTKPSIVEQLGYNNPWDARNSDMGYFEISDFGKLFIDACRKQ